MTRHVQLAASLIVGLVLAGNWATAQEIKRPEFVAVRVGLGGYYKAGLWTPVELTIRGGSRPLAGQVAVIVPDGDGVPSEVITPEDRACQLLPGRDTSVLLYVRFGAVHSDLKAEFRIGDKPIAWRTFETAMTPNETRFRPALQGQRLIVSVGLSSLGIEEAARQHEPDSDRRPEVARVVDIEQLPTRWYGYEGVDALVLSTSQPDVYRKLTVDNARVEALDQWIRMGGKLVLCVASQGDQLLVESQPLARFAPGALTTMATLSRTDLGQLETFTGTSSALAWPADEPDFRLSVPQLADVQGKVEVAAGADLPLVVRTTRGMGEIVFLAADLDRAPFNKWNDRHVLVGKLLGLTKARAEEGQEDYSSSYYYGYNDVAGQLRSALGRFTGVKLVPFWVVALLVVGYILLIGPGDYFFVRKVLRRMELTWITFPAIVVGVSLGAYMLAYYLKGSQLRVNQVDLVDVDTTSGMVRGTTWANTFSPRMESFNFTLRPNTLAGEPAEDSEVLMAWFGQPGQGLGGMDSQGGGGLFSKPYKFNSELSAMDKVPIQVWSTKSLTSRWKITTETFPDATLIADGDRLDEQQSKIANTLDVDLEQCVLIHADSAYVLDTLKSGQSVQLRSTNHQTLQTYLTEKTMIEENDNYYQQATPFDPENLNPNYVIKIMAFFEAAGGDRYVHFANDYQRFVDMSNLPDDRAVLFARADAGGARSHHGAELLNGNEPMGNPDDEHLTFYRFVFPVMEEGGQ